jgi:hypothetical protein
MTELSSFLAGIRAGEAIPFPGGAVVPLFSAGAGVDADLLEEGLARGATEVAETHEAGAVNAVRVRHAGPRPLLLLGGEEIVGAKQNRIFNASFVVAAGTIVELPVSCVEKGRWHYRSRRFSSSGRTVSAELRAGSLRRVSASMTATGRYDADQAEVWRTVEALLTEEGVRSPTSAYADLVDRRAAEVEASIEALAPAPDQVGLAVVRRGRVVVADVLGSSELFRRAWRKLARGLPSTDVGEPTAGAAGVVRRALEEARSARCGRQRSPAAGDTLHAITGELTVAAVTLGAHLYHAAIAAA